MTVRRSVAIMRSVGVVAMIITCGLAYAGALERMRSGDYSVVKKTVEKTKNPTEAPYYGACLAVIENSRLTRCQKVELLNLLIDRGVRVNALGDNGRTALLAAVELNDIVLVRLLVNEGANVDAEDSDGETPFTLATKRGQTEIVQLRKEMREHDMALAKSDLLFEFARQGDLVEVRRMIEQGASYDPQARTPLMGAAAGGHSELTRLLIEKLGADISSRDARDATAAHYAAENGHIDVLNLLIQLGVRIDGGDPPALHRAVINRHTDIIGLLVESGVDVNLLDKYGNSAMYAAATADRFDIVTLLADAGARPQKDIRGEHRNPGMRNVPTFLAKVTTPTALEENAHNRRVASIREAVAASRLADGKHSAATEYYESAAVAFDRVASDFETIFELTRRLRRWGWLGDAAAGALQAQKDERRAQDQAKQFAQILALQDTEGMGYGAYHRKYQSLYSTLLDQQRAKQHEEFSEKLLAATPSPKKKSTMSARRQNEENVASLASTLRFKASLCRTIAGCLKSGQDDEHLTQCITATVSD